MFKGETSYLHIHGDQPITPGELKTNTPSPSGPRFIHISPILVYFFN